MKKIPSSLRPSLSLAVRSTRLPRWGFLFTACLALTTGCGGAEASASESASESVSELAVQKNTLATLPSRCADIKAALPSATDGDYLLYYQHDRTRPWAAWCQDMATVPFEYVSLSQGGYNNASQYYNSATSSAVTMYSRLRIDPETLTVNTGDQRFSWSTGNGPLYHNGTQVKSMPYATAMSCINDGATEGTASIDLRGTPFAFLPNQFQKGGYNPHGSDLYGNQNQTATLKGGGYCGWMGLTGSTSPFNQNGGALKLQYLDLARPANCTDVRNNTYGATDGTYVLFVNRDVSKPWIAQCRNMQGAQPTHYVALAQGGYNNASQYYNSATSSAVTMYSGLRIDPATFVVDTSDQTFTWSTGNGPLYHNGTQVKSMPYATAMSCINDGTTEGTASIDLRGTAFAVSPNQLQLGGYTPHGSVNYTEQNQKVTLKGGGYCGWMGLVGSTSPFNQSGGSLQLNYLLVN